VGDLQAAIKKEKENALIGIDPHALDIWKLSSPIPSVEINMKLGNVQTTEEISGCIELDDPLDALWEHFSSPPRKHLHIVVELSHDVTRTRSPRTPEHRAKRPRLEESEMPCTPPNATQAALLQTQVTPPRLRAEEIEPAMLTALKPFTQYMTYLAEGKLDGYFNSIQPEDLVTDLNVVLPTRPMLLLHDLGGHSNREQIDGLFVPDTVFVSSCVVFMVDD